MGSVFLEQMISQLVQSGHGEAARMNGVQRVHRTLSVPCISSVTGGEEKPWVRQIPELKICALEVSIPPSVQ